MAGDRTEGRERGERERERKRERETVPFLVEGKTEKNGIMCMERALTTFLEARPAMRFVNATRRPEFFAMANKVLSLGLRKFTPRPEAL